MGNEFFGEEEFDNSGRMYLDLRAGWIAQTQKVELDENLQPVKRDVEKWTAEGYQLETTENQAGKKSFFMAKRKKSIGGYVTDLRWYANELKNSDVVLTGWKVTIETPFQTYVLQIGSQDRPYTSFMNSILNVDFDHSVRFKGYKKDGKKNLLLYIGDADGKDYILGKHPMLFLNWTLRQKLRERLPLTDEERQNIVWLDNGEPDPDYPYIVQKQDKKWSFEKWEEFLWNEVKQHVIPAIDAANARRSQNWKRVEPEHDSALEPDIPDGDDEREERAAIAAANAPSRAPITAAAVAALPDDDIPF